MSIQAMTWAYGQRMKSSVKFVLVTLCNYADAECRLWPSVADLVEKTCLDRKTVIAAVGALEAGGFLVDTGERKGKTRQIKVYRIVPDGGEGEGGKAALKRDAPGGGTVPFSSPKDAAFAVEGFPVSGERRPKTGQGIFNESLNELSGNCQYAYDAYFGAGKAGKAERFVPLGYLALQGVDAGVALDWLAMRKARKAQPTKTAIDGIAGEAAKAGMSLEEALKICCANGWQGFRADWIRKRERAPAGRSLYEQNMEAVARAKKLILGGQDA
ncbi:MAG: helix-turn-helix domain-containing protein [Oxalobacter formigenes]|nr:helix-turn-helix domain-containing protein [Oxalobacter formigenes]